MWRYVLPVAVIFCASPLYAEDVHLKWLIAEGGTHKAGVSCEDCNDFTHAMVSCESPYPGVLQHTTLSLFGGVCGSNPNCEPYLVVDGVRFRVRTEDFEAMDQEGVSIRLNDYPRLWKALENVHRLRFGMKGKQAMDLTLPGLTTSFARVLATCGRRP